MNKITDTDRIDFLIKNNCDVEGPDDNNTWVIYTPEISLGEGIGCHRDLRGAIDLAIRKYGK